MFVNRYASATVHGLILIAGLALASVQFQTSVSANGLDADGQVHPRLIRSMTAIYLVVNNKRRLVANPQVFTDYRFQEAWIEQIPDDDLNRVGLGPDLVAGPVLRDPSNRIWIVYQGTRRLVVGPDAYGPMYLRPDDAINATQSDLEAYPEARSFGNRQTLVPLGMSVILVAGGVLICLRRVASIPESHAKSAIGSKFFRAWHLWGDVAVLVAISAALKFWFVSLYPWLPDGADAPAYVGGARYLQAGNSIMTEDQNGTFVSVTSTMYPMLLALTGWVTMLTNGNVIGWKFLQVVCSSLMPWVVGALGHELYGFRTARVAAVIATLSPLWFYSAELLQYELWLGLAIGLGTLLVCRAVSTQRHRYWWVLCGVVWAGILFLQVKTAVLLAPIGLILWYSIFVTISRASQSGTETITLRGNASRLALERMRLIAVSAIPVVAFLSISVSPVIAWGFRNLSVHNEFIIGSTGSGTLLWMGSQPSATGGYMQISRPQSYYEREKLFPNQSVTRNARIFASLAIDNIVRDPTKFALLGMTKLERFWWTISPDLLGEYLEARTVSFLGGLVTSNGIMLLSKFTQYVVLFLACIAIMRARNTLGNDSIHTRNISITIIIILTFWITHIAFIAEPRYRLPIAPLIQVFEGAGLVTMVTSLQRFVTRRIGRTEGLAPDQSDSTVVV